MNILGRLVALVTFGVSTSIGAGCAPDVVGGTRVIEDACVCDCELGCGLDGPAREGDDEPPTDDDERPSEPLPPFDDVGDADADEDWSRPTPGASSDEVRSQG